MTNTQATLTDWDLITATLFATGTCNRTLSAEARARIWAQADGYGAMTMAQLRELHLLEDWSHIRDSSEQGKRSVAHTIRSELRAMDRQRARKLRDLDPTFEPQPMLQTVQQVIARLGVRS